MAKTLLDIFMCFLVLWLILFGRLLHWLIVDDGWEKIIRRKNG